MREEVTVVTIFIFKSKIQQELPQTMIYNNYFFTFRSRQQ